MGVLLFIFVLTLGISFAFIFFAANISQTSKSVQQRLVAIQQPVHEQKADVAEDDLQKPERRDYAARLGQFLQDYEFSKSLQILLMQADSDRSVGGVIVVCAAMAAVCSLAIYLLTHTPFLAVIALVAGAFIPYKRLKMQRSRRLKAFNASLPDAIDLLARALRAGHSVGSAIELLAEEAPDPLGFEFGQVSQQQKLGVRFREALLQMAARVPSRDLQFLITAILVQKETGGDLTEVLDRTAHVIRDRVRIEGEVRSHTAQGKLTGWILGCLPVAVLGIINLVSPGYSKLLFHDPTGQKLLYFGAGLILAGAIVIRKVVDVQV